MNYKQTKHNLWFSVNIKGLKGSYFIFLWAPKSLQMVIAAIKLKDAYSLEESYDQHRQHIKKQRHYFANKDLSSQGYGFSSGHVWMWELACEESWAPRNWCLDCKEIQPVHPKGGQSWVFIGRTDAEAETPILWPLHAKSWFIGKDSDAGRDWGREEKETTRGWDGWMASVTQWTWVWVNSRSWWWTGRPGVLRFMGSKEVGHNWVTELNWLYISVVEEDLLLPK